MNPRVLKVTPTDDYKLIIKFTNGEEAIYDCNDLLDYGVFKELRDKNYFKQVIAIHGSIAWPHDQDICPDTVYLDSKKENSLIG